MPRVRVLTWNVWFGAHMFEERSRALIRELERRRPDVIALQEVTPPLLRRLERDTAGYTLHGADTPMAYDVLLMTRVPVTATRALELPSQMGRRLLVAELANGLVVATVHLESTAPYFEERAAQLAIIGPALIAAGDDTCFVGDMNFDDTATLEPATLDRSFTDVWPALRRGEPGFTVDSVTNTMRTEFVGKARKRIDRVFVRGTRWKPTKIELVGTTPIDEEGTFTSDHFGLAVELEETG
jgi:tyrosyl-DNA phosphodiesterase 2